MLEFIIGTVTFITCSAVLIFCFSNIFLPLLYSFPMSLAALIRKEVNATAVFMPFVTAAIWAALFGVGLTIFGFIAFYYKDNTLFNTLLGVPLGLAFLTAIALVLAQLVLEPYRKGVRKEYFFKTYFPNLNDAMRSSYEAIIGDLQNCDYSELKERYYASLSDKTMHKFISMLIANAYADRSVKQQHKAQPSPLESESEPVSPPNVAAPNTSTATAVLKPKVTADSSWGFNVPVASPAKPTKTVYCKRCGSAIDGATRKCSGCGKQYFHLTMRPRSIAAGAAMLLVFSSMAYGMYEKDQQISALRIEISNKDEKVSNLQFQEKILNEQIKQLAEGETALPNVRGLNTVQFNKYIKNINGYMSEYYPMGGTKSAMSRKQKVYDYVNSLPLTHEQKVGLYEQYYGDIGLVVVDGQRLPAGYEIQ